MVYYSRSQGIAKGFITPRGSSGYDAAVARSRSGTRSYSGGVSAGTVKRTKDGRVLISGGVDSKGRQLWVTEDYGTYLYSYKGASGNLVLGGFDTSIPAGRAAEKSYLSKLYEKQSDRQREESKKQLAAQKSFEGQVDVLRGDLDKQFSSTIGTLKSRRWSPRFAKYRTSKANELSTTRSKLKGLNREGWLSEVEKLSKEKDTPIVKPTRRLTRPVKMNLGGNNSRRITNR